jgi:hypothetical protein
MGHCQFTFPENTMSNADKRSVHTDALATLGTIIDEHQKRDAIHLAVIPAIAGEPLAPGTDVALDHGVATHSTEEDCVGIVDPFLKGLAAKGDRFWLVIYPRVITSLRHVWTHPAIGDEVVAGCVPSQVNDKAVSEAWLRQYAKRVNCYLADNGDSAYETLMEDIRNGELTYRGTDMHSFGELQDADELQRHASIVLGRPVIWSDFSWFSCSC